MKKKVLIVDDEHGIVKLMSMRLRAKGYKVFEAFDGLECVNMAIKEMPHLILLDIKMPQVDGFGAFEKLSQIEKTKNIPIIFMTAYNTAEINAQALEIGAKECMSKPFTGDIMENTVRMYI